MKFEDIELERESGESSNTSNSESGIDTGESQSEKEWDDIQVYIIFSKFKNFRLNICLKENIFHIPTYI